MPRPLYRVIRDTREQSGQGWLFPASKNCQGTSICKLDTGDYTIEGFETTLCVERKGSIAEFAGNLFEARFEAELVRMEGFALAFVILEFTLDDVLAWPAFSSVPEARWDSLKLSPWAFLKRITELQLDHPSVHLIFAGSQGKAFVSSLFKRVLEQEASRLTALV